MADFPEKGKPEDFDRDECCRFKCKLVDVITTLVSGYRNLYWDDWENCLNKKWSIGDCITGCHNDTYDSPGHYILHRNSHQYCISKEAIKKAAEALSKADLTDNDLCNFENFYDWVSDVISTVGGIGDLSVYDTALRMGWNFSDGRALRRIEPREYVYLHQGALWGAVALVRISRLSGRDYINPDVSLARRIPISEFCDDLRSLGANHLENFLCVFHSHFKLWADGLDIEAKEKELEKREKSLKEKIKNVKP